MEKIKLMSHLVAGYATDEISLEVARSLVKGGADILEIQLPFSDPSADGPVIQQSDKRALNSGANTDDFFRIIKKMREYNNEIPVSILVYANVVLARGIKFNIGNATSTRIST